MSLKSVFISSLTAVLGVITTGCATSSNKDEAARVANMLPDYTVTNPQTGCRSFKDPKHPDKPQPCIIDELPKPTAPTVK